MHSRYAVAALLLALASSAHAVFTVNITETGGNVVATGSGNINTTGMTLSAATIGCSSGTGSIGALQLCLGSGSTGTMATGAVSPPISGLTSGGTLTNGSSSSGSAFIAETSNLYLPAGYVSGTPLSNTTTFNGQTFASMGLTTGTRTITLTSGDTIVVNIGASPTPNPTPVPTLSESGPLIIGLLILAGTLWSRRRRPQQGA